MIAAADAHSAVPRGTVPVRRVGASETDERAFRTLCEEQFGYVWASIHRLGVHGADAEDLAHDVLVTIHRRLPTFDRSRPLKPWIFGIALNVVRNHRRRTHARREREEDLIESVEDPSRSPEHLVELEKKRVLVERALDALPDERRAVFVLCELDEVPMSNAAAALGIPVQTGYSRLRKARDEFRAAVAALTGEAHG